MHRASVIVALVAMWSLAMTTTALADPPGPTDYMSEVTEVDPETDGFSIKIVGGDSFVLLTADDGVAIDVVGYQGEPYLRFLGDGTVEENRLSPSKYLNEDRYADSPMPREASADAEPEWHRVSGDGSFAWHDHRTHWMNEVPPPGRAPGDRVAEGVVPLVVAGTEVDVTVVSMWQQPPSSLPVAFGFTAGLLIAFALLRRRDAVLPVLAMSALATSVVGALAYLSVPAETGPPWSLWAFPVTAGLLTLVVAALGNRGGFVQRQRGALLLIAALELIGWGIAHWGWLWSAILPTSLPFWVDRFVASIVLVSAIGAAAAIVVAAAAPVGVGPVGGSATGLVREPQLRRPSRRRFRR
ncbi:MAG: hypothetical protein GY788_31265 [bacterium]|nr:hypothetical protein [bacterium]